MTCAGRRTVYRFGGGGGGGGGACGCGGHDAGESVLYSDGNYSVGLGWMPGSWGRLPFGV